MKFRATFRGTRATEKHLCPRAIDMSDYTHICIDGKNAIYRAVFAGYYDAGFKKTGYDFFVILLRFISNYVALLKPESIHIFWDAPRSKTWRKELVPEYKDHRTDKYKELDFDIHAELARQIKLAIMIFDNLKCRQYYIDRMEADDLIYSFCALNEDKTVIVSSDQDFRQITHKMNQVFLYNPLAKSQQIEPRPQYNIVIAKSLMGDKSDNISGYYNVGPVKSQRMSESAKLRSEFLRSDKAVAMVNGNITWVGDEVFKKNRRIIDLSWCPELANNCEYVEKKQGSKIKYSKKKIEQIARDYKIRGLLADLARYAKVFEPIL